MWEGVGGPLAAVFVPTPAFVKPSEERLHEEQEEER
jgi:hypothetical protein